MSDQLDINAFLMERGRLPHLGDEIPPWRYRGWLLWYCQLGHIATPASTGNRWGYWMRTLEAGELLAEPIPQIDFGTRAFGQSNSEPMKSIQRALRIIENSRHSIWDSFRLFIEWLAWGMATSKAEPVLEDEVQELLYRDFDLKPWLEQPGDHLGEYLASTKASGWNPTAFFPTPHALCEMMARMTFGVRREGEISSEDLEAVATWDGRDTRLLTVCDPAVGTGRMLLHAAAHTFCLFGQDIDPLVVNICKVNGALYAPWLAFPMPAEMLARCNAAQAIEPPPKVILSPGEPPPVPEELEAIAEAIRRARELATAVISEPEMEIDRRGQGLLFGPPPTPRKRKRRGSHVEES